jgi:hypothetical protein
LWSGNREAACGANRQMPAVYTADVMFPLLAKLRTDEIVKEKEEREKRVVEELKIDSF